MAPCPDRDELLALVQCLLEDVDAERLERHLDECEKCRQTLRKLEVSEEARLLDFSIHRDSLDSQVSRFAESMERNADADAPLELPETFGPYRILGKVGEGGMGEVFAAVHERLKRKVALKFVRRRKALNPHNAERFRNEIEAAGKLNHPNIVTTYDADEFQGIPYLAMEFLEGETLREYAAHSKKLAVDEVCRMILQAARGLRCIHEAGLVHCDLKPSNLWRTPDGTVKVLDLGLAQIPSEDPLAPGLVGGTPDFMAPEQCETDGSVDARADIYALGCTLFALLVQKTPFSDEKYPTIQKKMEAQRIQPLPRLTDFRNDVPPTLQKLLDRMTEKNPLRRFHTMGEVISALETMLDSNPRRKPSFGKVAFWFAVVILLLGGSTLLWLNNAREPEIQKPVPVEVSNSETIPESEIIPEPETIPEPEKISEPEIVSESENIPESESTIEVTYSQSWYTDPYFAQAQDETFQPSPGKKGATSIVLLSPIELNDLRKYIRQHRDLNTTGINPYKIRQWCAITESPQTGSAGYGFVFTEEEIAKRKETLGDAVPVEPFPVDYFSNFLKLKKYAESGILVYLEAEPTDFDGYRPIDLRLIYFPDIRKLAQREEILQRFTGKARVHPRTKEVTYCGDFAYFIANDRDGIPLLTSGTEKPMPGVAPLGSQDSDDLTPEEYETFELHEVNALYYACHEGFPLEYSNVHPVRIRKWLELRGISDAEYAEWLRKYQELQYPK